MAHDRLNPEQNLLLCRSVHSVVKASKRVDLRLTEADLQTALAIYSQQLMDFLTSLMHFFQHPSELRLEFLKMLKCILKRFVLIQEAYKEGKLDAMLEVAHIYFREFEDVLLAIRFQNFAIDLINHWLGEPSLSAKETLPVLKAVHLAVCLDYYRPQVRPHLPKIFSKVFEIDFYMDHRLSSLKPHKKAIRSLLTMLHRIFSSAADTCFQILHDSQSSPALYEYLLFKIFVVKGSLSSDLHDKFVFILNSFMKDHENIPDARKALKLLRVHIDLIGEFSVNFISRILTFLKNLLLKDAENDLGVCSKVSELLRDLTISEKFDYKFGNVSENFLEFFDLTDMISHDSFMEFIIKLIE